MTTRESSHEHICSLGFLGCKRGSDIAEVRVYIISRVLFEGSKLDAWRSQSVTYAHSQYVTIHQHK